MTWKMLPSPGLLVLVILLGGLEFCPGAKAQVACTAQSQASVLSSFADNVASGSITPATVRNLICSTGNIVVTPTNTSAPDTISDWLSYVAGGGPSPYSVGGANILVAGAGKLYLGWPATTAFVTNETTDVAIGFGGIEPLKVNASDVTFGVPLGLPTYAISTLPPVLAPGEMAYVSNCIVGTGAATGCPYFVNTSNVWTPLPNIPTQGIIFGPQTLVLGTTAVVQGNGAKVQLSTGSAVSGHCVQFDANGNTLDSGSACGSGGGGSGTVASGIIDQLAWYSATGTTVAGLATAANGVLVTSSGSVPSISSTLPSVLTIPAPVITGSASAVNLALSGKLSAAASGAGSAGFNVGQGTTPSSPINGDVWATTSGLFAYINSTTIGPFGTSNSVISSGTTNQLAWYAANGTTLSGLTIVDSAVLVTSSGGVPSEATTLPGGITYPSATLTPHNYATSSLPSVTSANSGEVAFVTDCKNGSQTTGTATGCLGFVNTSGAWITVPSPFNSAITVGGQALYPGNSTTNQGNGGLVQLSTGTATSGHCVQFDANGNTVDSGAACGGGGGGSGTVSSGSINQLAWYSATGTTVAGLALVPSAVLVTSASSVPSESTTLPSGLTIPSPTITGTATAAGLSIGGRLSATASTTTQASVNIAQGTAPSTPVNGDIWTSSTGVFAHINGANQGPFSTTTGTITSVSTTAPVTGGPVTSGGITVQCPTCLTGTSGGPLAATAPLAISGITLSLQNQPGSALYPWPASVTVTADNWPISIQWPWATGTITSVVYYTGGTSTPSFNGSLQIAGTNITGCTGFAVSLTTTPVTSPGTATCTAANTITRNQSLNLITTSVVGSPFSAAVQINFTRSGT